MLKGIDFDKINPILFTIKVNLFEINDINKKEKIKFFEEKNYKLINIIGVNTFFVKNEYILEVFE